MNKIKYFDKFDENFPSLKYELLDNDDCRDYNSETLFILKSDVEKYCLDKVRVKKAIEDNLFHGKEEVYKKELLRILNLGDIGKGD